MMKRLTCCAPAAGHPADEIRSTTVEHALLPGSAQLAARPLLWVAGSRSGEWRSFQAFLAERNDRAMVLGAGHSVVE
jgi:hypothetical protein